MITRLGQLGKALDDIMTHGDFIIHTGSYQGEQKSVDYPKRYLMNIQNTFKYLEQAREENKTFVYISTWDEANNPYVESKRTCERMVEQWGKTYNLPYAIIRIPSIIGRGIIHKFIETQEELEIKDRELEFTTIEKIAITIKDILDRNCLNETQQAFHWITNKCSPLFYEDYKINCFRIHGEKISVQLLYDLIRYTVRKVK